MNRSAFQMKREVDLMLSDAESEDPMRGMCMDAHYDVLLVRTLSLTVVTSKQPCDSSRHATGWHSLRRWCGLSRSTRMSEYMAEVQTFNWADVVPWRLETSSFMQCDAAEGAETREVFDYDPDQESETNYQKEP
jgi:hypothetical protein